MSTLNQPIANNADGRSIAGVSQSRALGLRQEGNADCPTAHAPQNNQSCLSRASWINFQDCPGNAHLLGIAGSGMRALARVLCGWGWKLTGSDTSPDAIKSMALPAVSVRRGHAAGNVPKDADIVIHSDAVAVDNVELRRAVELGIPTATYFQVAGQMMRWSRGVAVAGTHGKSTTTAMVARILTEANLDPTVLCGATALGESDGGRAGRSDLILVEACEYRRNFLNLRPRTAAILGVEPDHFDCYNTPDELYEAFGQFASSVYGDGVYGDGVYGDGVYGDGVLLVRHDCRASRLAAASASARVETFGFDECGGGQKPDWSARLTKSRRGRYRFEILRGKTGANSPFCEVSLQLPGRHNVLNALAAAALAFHQGVDADRIADSLAGFRGLCRRLECLGTWRGVTVLDDYAHHPTEVTATLDTVRRMYPDRRLYCIFQPHQASRTARLLDELAKSLQNVDCLAVADIFRAREGPVRAGQVTAADLAARIGELGTRVSSNHSMDDIYKELTTWAGRNQLASKLNTSRINHLKPGDVLLTIGAGDIRRIADGYIHWIRENRAAG